MVPKEYQLAGVEYALNRRNALIGDAPGLGKTAECIMLGNAIEAGHTLVICPASLRLNWEREIWMWSTQENVSTYPVLKSKDGVSLRANYVITSYAMLTNRSIFEAIMDARWDHLILDEAHALKDPKGNTRTKAICGWNDKGVDIDGLADVSGRITMASGTILPNQPIECYNALRLLDHDAIDGMSMEAFRNAYYELGQGFINAFHEVQLPDGSWVKRRELHWSDRVRNVPANLDDLQERLRGNVMVRRTKPQVLHELPPVQWHVFPLQMTADIRRALKHPGWKQAETLYEMDAHAFDSSVPIDGAISTARRLLGEASAPGIVAYLKDMLAEGVTKIVVGAWHHTVLDYMREHLEPHGLVYMDGSTTMRNRQAAVDEFQENDSIQIILGQMGPLGEGWTLTAAQDVVLAEFDWVPGRNEQFLDRISRLGQEGWYTLGHVPVVPDTLSERILNTAIVKAQNIHKALDAIS